MKNVVINIKTEPDIKAKAQKLAEEMGLSLTAVINRYLKHFVKTKTITFEAEEEVPNEYFKRELKKAREDRKAGKASPIFDNAEDAIKWLHEKST